MDQQKHTTEDTLTDIFGSKEMRSPAPTEFIPKNKTAPEIAYQLVKDETYPQTQPRLNLATFVTTTFDSLSTNGRTLSPCIMTAPLAASNILKGANICFRPSMGTSASLPRQRSIPNSSHSFPFVHR